MSDQSQQWDQPAIHVRKLQAGPSAQTPRYWFANDPFLTHFFNAVSSTFPEGERFFVRSVRHYADRIRDPQLIENVSRFVQQEAQHRSEHDAHIELLTEQGYGVLTKINAFARKGMDWNLKHTPRLALAYTTATEHITAVLAGQILRHPQRWIQPMHRSMQPLWTWHAIEETEHKSVAFDVYQLAVGKLWLRRWAMDGQQPKAARRCIG